MDEEEDPEQARINKVLAQKPTPLSIFKASHHNESGRINAVIEENASAISSTDEFGRTALVKFLVPPWQKGTAFF